MKITEVEIIPVKPDAGLIAFASCVIDGALYLGSIAIFTRLKGGYRLVFPTKKIGERNLPYHHPISRAASEELEKVIAGRAAELFDYQPAS
jgi:stage V sporulation protein G